MTEKQHLSPPRGGGGVSTGRSRRGGRPALDQIDRRGRTIGVRVTPAELEQLRGRAADMGMTPAALLREAALSRRMPSPPVPAINRDEYASLARLAANLNQLAHAANSGQAVAVDAELLRNLTGEVARLRLALLGVEV